MSQLVPCTGCARHVRPADSICPFCGAALPVTIASARGPTPRMGRAARFAFGAAVATTLGVTACGESHDAGVDAGHDAGLTSEPGLPNPDAGPPDAGADAGTGVDAGTDLDGGHVPDAGDRDTDAGDTDAGEEDAGGIVPPYGAPPAD